MIFSGFIDFILYINHVKFPGHFIFNILYLISYCFIKLGRIQYFQAKNAKRHTAAFSYSCVAERCYCASQMLSSGSGEYSQTFHPRRDIRRIGASGKSLTGEPLRIRRKGLQVFRAGADSAGRRGAERNDRLSGQIIFLQECPDDIRSLAPPDRITEEYRVVIFGI